MAFAARTEVSVVKTQGDIRTMVNKAGAIAFALFEERERAHVAFELHERRIRFTVSVPTNVRHQDQIARTRWRALMLVIKAKLEAVESKIETFDEAFLAHIQRPSGRTVMEEIREGNMLFYKAADVPLLPGPKP